ncbi:MAG: hypothetical protein Q9169_002365 [Polycauliona sp. 2 TL-2023]
MPSPAALAKFAVAIMITPFTQEPANPLPHQGTVDIPLNQEIINGPLHQEAILGPVDQGSSDTSVYGNRHVPLNTGGVRIAGNSGIYMCVDGGFTGYCRYFSNPFGQCSKSTLCCRLMPVFDACDANSKPGWRPGPQGQRGRSGQRELVYPLCVSQNIIPSSPRRIGE